MRPVLRILLIVLNVLSENQEIQIFLATATKDTTIITEDQKIVLNVLNFVANGMLFILLIQLILILLCIYIVLMNQLA